MGYHQRHPDDLGTPDILDSLGILALDNLDNPDNLDIQTNILMNQLRLRHLNRLVKLRNKWLLLKGFQKRNNQESVQKERNLLRTTIPLSSMNYHSSLQ